MENRQTVFTGLVLSLILVWPSFASAQDRSYWKHTKGHFENVSGNNWTEKKYSDTFHFVEQDRTEKYVELYDKSRDTTVRLHADQCFVKSSFTKNKFESYYQGQWSNATPTIEPLHSIRWPESDRFQPCDISADGSKFLVCRNNIVRVFDMKSGKVIRELPRWFAQFTPDGRSVVACGNADFHVYDLASGEETRGFDPAGPIWNYEIAHSGTRLVVILPTYGQVWNWSTGKRLCDIPWKEGEAYAIAADGRYVLIQSADQPFVRVFSAATGKPVEAYKHLPRLGSMSANGKRSLYTEGDTLKVFDVLAGREIRAMNHLAKNRTVLSGDGRLLLSLNQDRKSAGVWDVASGRRLASLRLPEPLGTEWIQIIVSANGKYALFASTAPSAYVFRLPEGSPIEAAP